MKDFNSSEAIKERAEKYGCDGRCYYNTGMCGGVDTCPETRTAEGIGSCLAAITIIATPILIIGAIVYALLFVY